VAQPERPLETSITLILEHASPELAEAHWDLYPERIPEHIPLSLTLLYPWIPAADVKDADLENLRSFFASREPFAFELTHVSEFPDIVVYAVPEPDDELRSLMRALWALNPEYPPYRQPGSDPPPHATLGRRVGPSPITVEEAEARIGHLLPVHCEITEATLMEEYAIDEMRIRETFRLGS
jgi:2'-5' RNA ligase